PAWAVPSVLPGAGPAAAAALGHARGHVAAQRRGIVYNDAASFDAAGRADVGVVSSRGTVLLGDPQTVALEAMTPKGPDGSRTSDDAVARVLALAAGAELAS